jgi:hypothetical protein
MEKPPGNTFTEAAALAGKALMVSEKWSGIYQHNGIKT